MTPLESLCEAIRQAGYGITPADLRAALVAARVTLEPVLPDEKLADRLGLPGVTVYQHAPIAPSEQ